MLTTVVPRPVTSLTETEPEYTLGGHVLNWTLANIRQPDGPDAGGPWYFTDEQIRFILWWYAIDHRGRFLYRRGVLRRMKGWGKSPVMAALALAELCGPVRFAGWDENGQPLAKKVAAPWVQLAGVSEKQTTNTMSVVLAMLVESPLADELDAGLTRIYTADGGRLEYITSSAPTAEGARPTFVVEDETHWWTETNGGHALDRVNRRNLGKSRDGAARMLETTNAHIPGEDSVAERSFEAWQAQLEGKGRSTGLLYDTREGPADVELSDPDDLWAALIAARGDSVWLDLERIRDEIYDPSTPASDGRRFYLNQLTHATDSWLSQPEWAARLAVDRVVADGEKITLGFDGSQGRSRGKADATALVGCCVSDGHIFDLEVWEQPDGPAGKDWQVPTIEIEAAIRSAFRNFTVVGFYADPAKWGDHVARWEAEYHERLVAKSSRDHPISFQTNRLSVVVTALDSLHSAIVHGGMTHSGSSALTRHFLNARRRPSRAGILIGKEHPESSRKIDAAYAAMLAWAARLDALAKGVEAKQPSHAPYRIR